MMTICEQADRDGDQGSDGVLPRRGLPSKGITEAIAFDWLPPNGVRICSRASLLHGNPRRAGTTYL